MTPPTPAFPRAARLTDRRALPPLILALALAVACGAVEAPTASPAASPEPGDATPAARVDGEAITVDEVDARIKEHLFARETQGGDPAKLDELRRPVLDELIHERLLAREAGRQGVSPEGLLDREAGKAPRVSEEEVIDFFEQHKPRLGDTPYADIAPQIRSHLEQLRGVESRRDYLASLRDDADVDMLLDVPRVPVRGQGPQRGPDDAPVTIVEFSDYQCPFCQRVEATVQQVLARYPQEVRFVYRHFPLDRHPAARKAAEAAVCAEEQGRFWEYHERLFADGAQYDEASLSRYAADVELEMDAFEACRKDERARRRVDEDLAAGREAGVTGTPAFFINGIRLSGARPLEAFVEVIDGELARARDRS